MRLYELAKEFAALESEDDAAEGGLPAGVLAERLEACKLVFAEKTGGVVRWLKNLDAEVAALKGEEERLRERRKSREGLQERLRGWLLAALEWSGERSLKSELYTVTLGKPRDRVVVDETEVVNWQPEFFDAALKAGALREVFEVNLSLLKKLPGWDQQPGVTVLEGKAFVTIK